MGLITLILTLAVVGFILYLIITYIPMPPPFKQVIIVVIVIVLILWVAQQFGVIGSLNTPLLR
jgi:integral membrane sensor domain MASE1